MMILLERQFLLMTLLSMFWFSVAKAEVPVVDLALPASANTTTQDQSINPTIMSTDDQINQLTQQMKFIQNLSLPSQIQQLKDAIQDLRGIIEIQGREIQQLQEQQRSVYNDLDRRISKLSLSSNDVSPSQIALPSLTNAPKTPEATPVEMQMYQTAFNLIKSKQYSEAAESLNHYLVKYPRGKFAGDAHYWMGEIDSISGNSAEAKAEFLMIIKQYPTSDKVPNALLKLGNLANENSNWKEAQQWWAILIQKYPQNSLAKIAQSRLDQLEKTGIISNSLPAE